MTPDAAGYKAGRVMYEWIYGWMDGWKGADWFTVRTKRDRVKASRRLGLQGYPDPNLTLTRT